MLGKKHLDVTAVDSVDVSQPRDSLLLGQRLCTPQRLARMLLKLPETELLPDFGLAHAFNDLYARIAQDEHASAVDARIRGERVRTLIDGVRSAGRYEATWDGRDDGGRAVEPGAYFVRLEADGRSTARRMMWMR